MPDPPKQTAPAPAKPDIQSKSGRYPIQSQVSIKDWNVPIHKVINHLYGQR